MTIFIMGMILLIVNVILIAILKSSARSDTSIRVRQLMEFGFEVVERNAKSAEPNSLCIARFSETNDVWECMDEVSGSAIMMSVVGSGQSVVFHMEENEDGIGILKAFWIEDGGSTEVYLTNSGEVDVEEFEVDLALNYETGSHEIILRALCDSITRLEGADPLVNDLLKTVTIVTKSKEA